MTRLSLGDRHVAEGLTRPGERAAEDRIARAPDEGGGARKAAGPGVSRGQRGRGGMLRTIRYEAREGEGFGRLYKRLASVAAPLLLLHGERDERCAVARAKATCQAVLATGVPALLALYPGARVLEHPAHRRDAARRMCEWLFTHMPPVGAAASYE